MKKGLQRGWLKRCSERCRRHAAKHLDFLYEVRLIIVSALNDYIGPILPLPMHQQRFHEVCKWQLLVDHLIKREREQGQGAAWFEAKNDNAGSPACRNPIRNCFLSQ